MEPECRISVADFEGPLDLLLYLINRNRLDITDIPIALVTRQYLDYLEIIKAFNVAVAGEYLVMAATLIQIKSRMLLPVPEPEPDDDPRLEITGPLQELASIRALASRMDSMPMLGRDVFFRGKAVFEASVPCEPAQSEASELIEVKVSDLVQAMERVLDRASSDMAIPVDRERVSLEAGMEYVMDRLSEAGGRMVFFDMFDDNSRGVVIVTFLAILELANRAAIYILQKEHGGDIILLSRT